MRAVVIDPWEGTVEAVDLADGYAALREAVGGDVAIAHVWPDGDTLYVADDGLIEAERAMAGGPGVEASALFDLGLHQPFAGRGVIVGREDGEGALTPSSADPAALRARVSFYLPRAVAAEPGPHGAN